jgi:hypothetical protein
VHFSNFGAKYDDWIEQDSPRLQKQWQRGDMFKLNNRIDVKDTQNNWLEARVIKLNLNNPKFSNKIGDEYAVKIDDGSITVKYKGYTERWNETFEIEVQQHSENGQNYYTHSRIDEIGMHSQAFGCGRVRNNELVRQNRINNGDVSDDEEQIHAAKKREDLFETNLYASKSWHIKQIAGDGNCLFRAVSHQVYGTEDHHKYIRKRCMDYIENEQDYFKDYITGNLTFEQYIAHKRKDGIWGDNLEIQALSEIYNCPLEIYCYKDTPDHTFNGNNTDSEYVIRISYHTNSHYNSIVDDEQEQKTGVDRVMSHEVGLLEDKAIALGVVNK